MPNTSFEYPMPGNAGEFFLALAHAVLNRQPAEAIYVFAEQQGPRALASPPADDASAQPTLSPAQCRAIARAFISRVPRPELRFAAHEEPCPQPGDPCDCGSGLSYEQCCDTLSQRISSLFFFDPLLLMLSLMPRRQWPDLAHSAISPEMVADAANNMLAMRDDTAALALLAPWFEGKRAISATHNELLIALLGVYRTQDQPRKKRQLLEKALKRGDHVIRSTAHQHLAMLAVDSDNLDKAWQHFEQARLENPADIHLSHLEVMLLLGQDDEEEARARAQSWLEQLTPQGIPEDNVLVDFLRNVVERGSAALLDFVDEDEEFDFDILYELLDEAPDPAACYHLPHATENSTGEWMPGPALATALHLWQREFPQEHPVLTGMTLEEHSAFADPDEWLALLETYPLLWQSLEVLDDLVLALDAEFGEEDDVYDDYEELRERLLERAQTLLELNLRFNRAESKILEWAFHGNRPALRLIAQRIHGDGLRPARPETLARIEWMLALNPPDNHGMREQAMRTYLSLQQFDKALALSERYPSDASTDVLFGAALALFSTGQTDAAAARLAKANKFTPKVAPMLLAANPGAPESEDDTGFITHGGDYQAWLYRMGYLHIWQRQPGALEWLRTQIA